MLCASLLQLVLRSGVEGSAPFEVVFEEEHIKNFMASTTQSRRLGWWCSTELLAALIIVTTLLRGCSGVTPVPVVVSTVYRSVPNVTDVAVDGAGTLLLLTYDGVVYRGLPNGTTAELVAFSYDPSYYGITCDVAANIAYVTGLDTYRVYSLVLSTKHVRIFAGSGDFGVADGVGTAAQFGLPWGIVHFAPTGLLYVADLSSGIRKIVVATAAVTTVANIDAQCRYLCITADGAFVYGTTYTTIVRVSTTQMNSVTTLAGSSTYGYQDGMGVAAQFSTPLGIALNSDESALIIADCNNYRIRRLELSNNSSATIAGSSTYGAADGPGLSASFSLSYGARWYCNQSSMLCGVLLADVRNNAVRFVAVEGPTATAVVTASLSAPLSGTASATACLESSSWSGTASASPSHDVSGSQSKASHSTQLSVTVSLTRVGTETVETASRSESTLVASATHSASATSSATVNVTCSRSSTWLMTVSMSWLPSPTCSRSHTASRAITALSVSPTYSSLSVTRQRSGTQRSVSASPTVYCALVPGGASGTLASLHRVDLRAADGAVAIVGVEIADNANVTNEVVGELLSRQALVGGNALAANMSLALGGTVRGVDDAADGWALVDALLDVVTTAAAFPVLSATAGVTVVSSRVAGREQLLVFLLRPPNGTGSRWLPSTLSVFRDVTLRLRLRLRCPTDASVTQDVVVVVPSPGEAVVLAAEVRAAGVASQYASWAGAPAAGSAVGRLSAVRSLVLCNGDASVGGILSLRAAVDCKTNVVGSSSAADARDAVLGNLVLWAAGCALMGLLTCGYSRCAGVSLRTAAEALGVPSPLLPLVVATVPSTASSTVVLLRSSCAADNEVAALGAVMDVLPLAVLCGVALMVAQQLHATPRTVHTASAARCVSAHLVWVRLLHRRLRWAAALPAAVSDAADHGEKVRPLRPERVATVVLLEYAVVWYLCVDVAVLTAAGLLGAVSTLGSLAACRGSAVAVAVLYVGQLVLCAAVRPYTTLFSHVHTLFSLTLTAVSVWCLVWYLFASVRDGADLESLGALLAVSAVCDIAVSAASMLKTLMDVVEALRACYRHAVVVMASLDGRFAIAEGPVLSGLSTPLVQATDKEVPLDVGGQLAEYDDAHFWRSDGSAAVGSGASEFGAAVVRVSTAFEDVGKYHRGASHDLLLLHFRDPVLLSFSSSEYELMVFVDP